MSYETSAAMLGVVVPADDFTVEQDGFPIKVNANARRWTEILLALAHRGALGVDECFRLHGGYWDMARRLEFRAEAETDPKHRAWLTYWAKRHKEIADGFCDAFDKQHNYKPEEDAA